MKHYRTPKFYRPSKGNRFSWEIYGWDCWYLTISLGTFEMQLNKWSPKDPSEAD